MNEKLDPEKVKKVLQIVIAVLTAILGGIGYDVCPHLRPRLTLGG